MLPAAPPLAAPLPRPAVDPTAAKVTALASSSITVEITTKSAPLLELHLGALVGACAGTIAEAVGEYQNGGLTSPTKGQNGRCLAELYRLRQFMLPDYPNFDSLAKERGIAMLQACDVAPAAANMLVNAVMEILAKIVRDEAN